VPRYRHLTVPTAPTVHRFTSTRSGRDKFRLPQRNRREHATSLIRQFNQATANAGRDVAVGNGFYQVTDLTLTFKSDPNFSLAFESLDLPRSGINLLAVSTDDQARTVATVRVPQDKLGVLFRKLEAYRDNDPAQPLPAGAKPKRDNRKLAESITHIRRATLRHLWTDPAEDYPAPGQIITWEVWLRRPNEPDHTPLEADDEAEDVLQQVEAILEAPPETPDTLLRRAQDDFGFTVVSQTLDFVDRSVVLVRGTLEQLSQGVDILGIIAEVRKAKVTADFFEGLPVEGQHDHIEGLNGRLVLPPADAPAIALLDTGVNRGHPLLAPVITDDDLHAHTPAWGVHDTDPKGHGTGMAGLALYGDLTPVLSGNEPLTLAHRLESLKLIHQDHPHPEQLYGAVTIEGISRLEVRPHDRRVFCMAVTTDGKDRGRPTSWSAAVDNLAAGAINDTRRLIIISAGNMTSNADYPNDNESSSLHDPAQAWNALTVGGTTDKAFIDQQENPGWTALAQRGDIAPASTTSLTWPRSPRWPFKPDLVMEAGNMGRSPYSAPMYLPELTVLTTSDEFAVGQPPLRTFQETSAATAMASRLAAALWA
jgi:subtilase family protein